VTETSDLASGATARRLTDERNKRHSERRGQAVGKRLKRAIQRAARRASRGKEKEMSDLASGTVGKRLTGEKNTRYRERRGGQGVEKRKNRAIQRAAARARD
jgi:antirestriction protein ArdC